MTRHTNPTLLLLCTLFLSGCGALNRWEQHKKENTEPVDPKIEAPFTQIPEPGRDDPYQPLEQRLGERNLEKPRVVETLSDPNKGTILTGIPLEGKPGFVLSPYAPDRGLVDVTGFPAGTDVRDPYTGQIMRVPPPTNAAPPMQAPLGLPKTPDPVIPQVEN